MATSSNLTKNNTFDATIPSSTKDQKYVFNTAGTYLDRNIQLTFSGVTKDTAIAKLGNASLNNAGTEGITYTSNTDASTIIPAEGALYINEGYIGNTKIDLAQLIPDDVEYTNSGSDQIRYGYEAYDTDGKKLIGTIVDVTPTFTGGGVTVQKPTITSTKATATINSSGTLVTNGTTYGISQTQPTSGTDGKDYLSIDGTLSTTSGSAKTTAYANRSDVTYASNATGYINIASTTIASAAPASSASASSDDTTIGVTATDNFAPYYIPIVTPAFDGGEVTVDTPTINVTAPNVTISESGSFFSSGSSYGITSNSISGTDGTNYLTISNTITSTNGKATTTAYANRSAVLYNGAKKGLINIADNATASAAPSTKASSAEGSKDITPSTTNNFEDYYIPITSMTAGDTVITPNSVTLSDTNNGISIKASGTVSTGAGAILAATQSTKEATKYITAISVPKNTNFTLSTVANTTTDSSTITITNNAYRKLSITNATNGIIVTSNSGTDTITNSGTVTATGGTINAMSGGTSSAHSGTVNVNAYETSSSTSTTNKTIVSNGNWVSQEIDPSTSTQGPVYGRITIKPVNSSVAISTLGSENITGSVSAVKTSAASAYNNPSTVDLNSEIPQIVLTGNGSMTTNKVYNGTANAATKYINYYTGSFTYETIE